MNLNDMAQSIHANAVNKGFWDPLYKSSKEDAFIFFAKQLAMVHSEVTEVLEALRKSKGSQQVVEELADIIIRVLDLYEGLREENFVTESLDDVLADKMQYNTTRPMRHGVAG